MGLIIEIALGVALGIVLGFFVVKHWEAATETVTVVAILLVGLLAIAVIGVVVAGLVFGVHHLATTFGNLFADLLIRAVPFIFVAGLAGLALAIYVLPRELRKEALKRTDPIKHRHIRRLS